MSIIACIGNKGGAGKTTISINVAAGLSTRSNVCLLDADPQQSAWQWSQISDVKSELTVVEARADLANQIDQLAEQFDHVLIDCPPYLQSEQTGIVLLSCDIGIVPVLPSPLDIWATTRIEDAVSEIGDRQAQLSVHLVINQLETRTTLSKVTRDALAEIEFPVCSAEVRRRAVYRNSVLAGKSVFDMGSAGRLAREEIEQLIKEVILK